jgi:predicted secreted protein
MTPVSAIVVFVVIWWLVFFMALPFGVKRSEHVEPGHDPGAPARTHLGLKALITTGVTIVLWGVFFIVQRQLPADFLI